MNVDYEKYEKVEMENGDILLKRKEECPFKVGDWVTFEGKDPFNVTSFWRPGKVFKIRSFETYQHNGITVAHMDRDWGAIDITDCRKATPQEILKAKGIEEGKWCYYDEWDHLYQIGDLHLVSYEVACEIRLATKEEILNKIAKYSVGEEVWSEPNNQFVKVTDRQLSNDKTQVEYATNGEVYCWHFEKELEERPPQKFKVGDRVVMSNFKEKGSFEISRIEWDGEEWLYYYPDGDFDYGQEIELWVEPKRKPKAGEVWQHNCGALLLITETDSENLLLAHSTGSIWLKTQPNGRGFDINIWPKEFKYLCDFIDFEPKKYIKQKGN